jgi:ABC-2 type transport system ATP-binding protein/lipopolysaccharide transport system ATP-binding protein
MSSNEPRVVVTELSKRYSIGSRSTTAREALMQRLHAAGRGPRDEGFWSLRDVSFAIENGGSLGVIGHNGAGKSTLLKILAGITAPTLGTASTRGRIAALLEVGTGFHPELTGRENVFLNGAILGMTRSEIRRRFDDIVEFSGVARFLDTPVKRYSSGMYLRLGFSVAAHLEPDILIVDEILAVGDAEFQQKCLGRMADSQEEGRTLVFVSHDLETLGRLCDRALWFENGQVREDGDSESVIRGYLSQTQADGAPGDRPALRGKSVSVTSWQVQRTDDSSAHLSQGDALRLEFVFVLEAPVAGLDVAVIVTAANGVRILDELLSDRARPVSGQVGAYSVSLVIPGVLTAGNYTAGLWIGTAYEDLLDIPAVIPFSISGSPKGRPQRVIALDLPVLLARVD